MIIITNIKPISDLRNYMINFNEVKEDSPVYYKMVGDTHY